MCGEKRERKYYKIRVDVAWGIVLCLSVLILIAFWGRQGLKGQENEFVESDRGERVEVNYDGVKSELLDVEHCYLCGNSRESLMGYYRKFDTVGLISLNDWYVVDFETLDIYSLQDMYCSSESLLFAGEIGMSDSKERLY